LVPKQSSDSWSYYYNTTIENGVNIVVWLFLTTIYAHCKMWRERQLQMEFTMPFISFKNVVRVLFKMKRI